MHCTVETTQVPASGWLGREEIVRRPEANAELQRASKGLAIIAGTEVLERACNNFARCLTMNV